MSYSIAQVNVMPRDEFVHAVGPVFEHSPWIAERVVDERPFADTEALSSALFRALRAASSDEQLGLIQAHPDLVGRAVLTAESEGEQAAAGLDFLSAEEVSHFDLFNREYKTRFGFPFVICARMNKKDAILRAFPERLQHTPEVERATALDEIEKIALLRLADLISE